MDVFEETYPVPPPEATVADVVAHLEHVRDVAGIDHVGIGGDFDGSTAMPLGLRDVSGYAGLADALRVRHWSEPDLEKLGHRNITRVLHAAEVVAAELRTERGPSMARISA